MLIPFTQHTVVLLFIISLLLMNTLLKKMVVKKLTQVFMIQRVKNLNFSVYFKEHQKYKILHTFYIVI